MSVEREALKAWIAESDGITVGIPIELANALAQPTAPVAAPTAIADPPEGYCPGCKGSGDMEVPDGPGPEAYMVLVNCNQCGGTGVAAVQTQRQEDARFALVPKRMTPAMRDVTDSEDWTWEDLLAAAGVITEAEHETLAASPPPQAQAQPHPTAAEKELSRLLELGMTIRAREPGAGKVIIDGNRLEWLTLSAAALPATFEQACAALPEGVSWGDALTPAIAQHIIDSRASVAAPPSPVPPGERSVADIPDADLLRRVVRSVVRNSPRRKEFAWAAVSEAFALGSTFAMQLCRRFGIDPDTGASTSTPTPPK